MNDCLLLSIPSEIFGYLLSYIEPSALGRLSITSKLFVVLSDSAAKEILRELMEKSTFFHNNNNEHIKRSCSSNCIEFLKEGCPALAVLKSLFYRNCSYKYEDISSTIIKRSVSNENILYLNNLSIPRIFLLGGSVDTGDYKNVDIYTPSTGTWLKCSKMSLNHGSFYVEAVIIRGEIYLISGDDYASAGTMEKYDYLKDTWERLPNMPKKNMFVSACVASNDSIIASGGIDHETGEFSDEIYIYHKSTWSQFGRLVRARYGHSSILFDNKLWFVGGHVDINESHSQSVEVYDLSLKRFETGPPMCVARIWHRLFVINDLLYAVGGDSLISRSLPSIEVYNVISKKWEIETEFKYPRKLYSSVLIGNKIYIFGGKDESYCNITSFEYYDVSTKVWGYDNNSIIPRESFNGGHAVTLSFA